jgi:hypothetical protein
VEEVMNLHHPNPDTQSYDLLNSKGLLLCHRVGCQSTRIRYSYGGFFCFKHFSELKLLRQKIYEVPYMKASREDLMIIKEYRQRELEFRKIMDAGHVEFMTAIDRRIELMDLHGDNFNYEYRSYVCQAHSF